MYIQNTFLQYADQLQIPLIAYHIRLFSPIYSNQNIYYVGIEKIILFVLGFIIYPILGTTSLLGKTVQQMIPATFPVHPSMIEEVNPDFHAENQEALEEIKNRGSQLLNTKTFSPLFAFPEITKSHLASIQEDYDKRFYPSKKLSDKIQMIYGGPHTVIFFSDTPTVVYKFTDGSKQSAEAEVEICKKALQICRDNNLFLLHVPESKVFQLPNGEFGVVQEKANVNADYYYQKGLYLELLKNPDSKEYALELHRELAILVALLKFGDVKYDNIPITKEGRVALFDLDQSKGVGGFVQFSSHGRKGEGLLKALPETIQEEVIKTASKHLQPEELSTINKHLPSINEKMNLRWKRIDNYTEYASSHHILTPSQKLIYQPIRMLGLTPIQRVLVKDIFKEINKCLELKRNWVGIKEPRTIYLSDKALFERHQYLFTNWNDFKTSVDNILKELHAIGYIHKGKYGDRYSRIKIIC